MSGLRHHRGAAAREAQQRKRERKPCSHAITISNSERAPVSPRAGKAYRLRIRTRKIVVTARWQ